MSSSPNGINRSYLTVALGAVLGAALVVGLVLMHKGPGSPAGSLSAPPVSTAASPGTAAMECDVLTAAWSELSGRVSEEDYETDIKALSAFEVRISPWYSDPEVNMIGQDLVAVQASWLNPDVSVFEQNMADLTRDYRVSVQSC